MKDMLRVRYLNSKILSIDILIAHHRNQLYDSLLLLASSNKIMNTKIYFKRDYQSGF
jgi:hypothetical protein